MTESQLRKRHGWSSNSRMPDRYVHIVNSDVDEALFEHYGIKKLKKTDKKTPQFCSVCKNANPYDSTICSQCGKPLDLETALLEEEKSQSELQIIRDEQTRMKQMMENIQKQLRNFQNS